MKTVYTYTKWMFVAIMAVVVLTGCSKDEDGYIASTLRNHDWQGRITEYYQNRWGISGSEYFTVMGFESKDAYYTSGRGYELDYLASSPEQNYAFCTFKWFIVDGDITIIYDDSKWDPVYIVDYELNSNSFYGYIYDGSNRKIKFDLESTTFENWDYYKRRGYRDLTSGYYARELEDDAKSMAEGVFAEILNSKE